MTTLQKQQKTRSPRIRRSVETTETPCGFQLEFESGLSITGTCVVEHTRQLILTDGEWVRGSHDVEVICDEELPYGTFGLPARVTVTDGHALVGTDNWKVFPRSRRHLAYGGD